MNRAVQRLCCLFGNHPGGYLARIDDAPEGYVEKHPSAPKQIGWRACVCCGAPIHGTLRYVEHVAYWESQV